MPYPDLSFSEVTSAVVRQVNHSPISAIGCHAMLLIKGFYLRIDKNSLRLIPLLGNNVPL